MSADIGDGHGGHVVNQHFQAKCILAETETAVRKWEQEQWQQRHQRVITTDRILGKFVLFLALLSPHFGI